jgi:hypothetical protein
MHTYMEVKGNNGVQHSYVSLTVDGTSLVLTKPKGFYQEKVAKIPLAEMKHLVQDEHFGAQRISFIYQNDYYQFYECGASVIDYMKEQLFV